MRDLRTYLVGILFHGYPVSWVSCFVAFLSCEQHEPSLQHVPTINIENMADRTTKGW